jgi:hypothetical protein
LNGGTILVRKLFFLFTVLFTLLSAACSESRPDVTSASQSDYAPVTEQKIVLAVTSLTDNPPMTYTWNYDNTNSTMLDSYGNVIVPGTQTNMYGAYWIAPQTPGIYTVSCTVGDKRSETDTAYFDIHVLERGIIPLMDANPASAASISYDVNAILGGIFAIVSNDKDSLGNLTNNIKMFSSTLFKLDTSWGGGYSLAALYPVNYSSVYTYYYAFWGSYISGSTINLIQHNSSGVDVPYAQPTTANDSVRNITMINNNIWISADTGLWKFDTSTTGFSNKLAISSYNADAAGSLSAVATSMGIYYSTTGDMNWQPLPSDQGQKTLSVVTLANPLNIFALSLSLDGTEKELWQYFKTDGSTWSSSGIPVPADISSVSRISKDTKGRIWVGKNRYNPTSVPGENPWFYPDTQNIITNAIDYTIASTEGLVYLKTTSGQLWVWGKTPAPYYPR